MTETRTYTAAQLAVSPLNVRYNEEDCNEVAALSERIVQQGLLQQLLIHPAPDDAGWATKPDGGRAKFGILAGGRRYRAITMAIAAGQLPQDFSIKAEERDLAPAEIILLSLSENLRKDLREYEINSAIAAAADHGMGEREIATRIGQPVDFIRRQLRLGHLAPEIFADYRAGRIDGDLAAAYAATDDHALQSVAWANFRSAPNYNHTPALVRAFYKVGDREHERTLAFVGDAIYRAAGGRFELDLFADGPERGRVVDEELLRSLVEEKLTGERARIRELAQERDLRFLPDPPRFGHHVDHSLELHDCETRSGAYRLPSPEIVATIAIDEDGQASPRFWWPSRKAKGDAERGQASASSPPTAIGSTYAIEAVDVLGSAGGQNEQAARRHVRDEHGFSADGLQVVRSTRRMLLRAILMTDAAAGGTLGRDYLAWSQLRRELTDDRDAVIGARSMPGEWNGRDAEPVDMDREKIGAQSGGRQWEAQLAACSALDPFKLEDPADAFEAFVDLTETDKNRCAAVVAGLSLLRSCASTGYAIPVHDRIADLASADDRQLRRFWEPDDAFVGMLPKLKRLELAEPFVGTAQTASWSKLPDREITRAASGALQDQPAWVHPLLSFAVTGPDYAEPDQAETMLEAAE